MHQAFDQHSNATRNDMRLEVNGAGLGLGPDALPGQGSMPDAGLSRAGRVLTAAGLLDPNNTSLADAAGADTSYQLVPGEGLPGAPLSPAGLDCCFKLHARPLYCRSVRNCTRLQFCSLLTRCYKPGLEAPRIFCKLLMHVQTNLPQRQFETLVKAIFHLPSLIMRQQRQLAPTQLSASSKVVF